MDSNTQNLISAQFFMVGVGLLSFGHWIGGIFLIFMSWLVLD